MALYVSVLLAQIQDNYTKILGLPMNTLITLEANNYQFYPVTDLALDVLGTSPLKIVAFPYALSVRYWYGGTLHIAERIYGHDG